MAEEVMPSSMNVRISKSSYNTLKSLSQGRSMQSVIDEAIEDLRRRRILEATNEAFAELKKNKALWKEELAERALWEKTLADGLSDDE